MKHYSKTILLILLLSISSCNMNQQPHNKESATDSALTKQDIQKAVEEFNQIMIDPNAKILEAFCSNELTYGHSSGLIQNKSEFIDDLVNGPYNFTSVTSPDLTLSFLKTQASLDLFLWQEPLKMGNRLIFELDVYKFFNENIAIN